MFSLSLSVSDNPYDEKKPGDGDENKLKEGSQRLAKLQKRREILKTRKPLCLSQSIVAQCWPPTPQKIK